MMNIADTGGVEGGGPAYVNPYHQAWAAQAEEAGLHLVEDWGVACIVMGGAASQTIDMFDFQHNQRRFPPNFFKKDPRTGVQRRFTCLVCNVSLFDEALVRTHCRSEEHHTRLADPRARSQAQVSIKKKSVDKRQLPAVLELSDEPAVGLENVVEWWPGGGDKEDVAPVYTCQLCDGWVGWGGDTAKHVAGEQHRRKQLVARYPVLEEMIADMDSAELKERAREEERKHARRYDVIQVVEDLESYQEFYQQLEGRPFRGRAPSQPPPGAGRGSHHPPGPGWQPQPPFTAPPPQLHAPPPAPAFRGRGHPRGHFPPGPDRGGYLGRGGPPPPRGPHPGALVPPPISVPPPVTVPPPMAVPPPISVPPPPPTNIPPPGMASGAHHICV